jgi:hypothetical protein
MILSICSRTKGRVCGLWHRTKQRGLRQIALSSIILAIAIQTTGCGSKLHESPATASEWREFQGTWTAAGSRSTLALGDSRRSAISHFTGSLMLSGESRPAVGFRSEAIVFSDSTSGAVGRAVWTDGNGDQVFSELRGEGTAANNKIVGTFLGGTGRYVGVTGSYEFSWRFLLESEDGTVQGQSVGLNGRVRLGQTQSAADSGSPR